ncbi:MAG: efflux RND transporter permease subunit [Pirellulaceae bacterium]|nr:efflux RND transporter permease subunit [Pirellulaceae bacterium]
MNEGNAPRTQPSLISFFARYPWMAIITIIAMTALAMIGYYNPYLIIARPIDVDSSVIATKDTSNGNKSRSTSLSNRSTRGEARRRESEAGSISLFGADVVMVVTSDNFFTPKRAQVLRAVVKDLESLPQVRNIMWMDEAPPLNIFGMPQPALPDHRASQTRFEVAREQAIQNPMIGGQLLSRDGKTALLLISLDWFHVRHDEDCTRELEKVARRSAESLGDSEISFAVTGELPMQLLLTRSTLDNDRKFQWLAYGVVLTLATILFRGPTAVLITALAPILGIFWTLGIVRFFELQDNPFTTVVVPVLLSMVGFADGVHMMTQIRKYRSSGMSGRESAIHAMNEVGKASFLTALTTAIGFGSLGWAHHEIVREFGWCCVIGVGITFIAVISVIPLACSTWLGRSVHHGVTKGLIESNSGRLSSLIRWILRYPRWVTFGGITISLACLGFAVQLRPDERMLQGIPEASSESIALRHIDRSMGGLETSSVVIKWTDAIRDGATEIMAVNEEIEKALRAEPLLGSPLGIATLVKALPGQGDAISKASMVDLLPPPLKLAFLRPEERKSNIVFRLQDIGIAKYGPVFGRVTEELNSITERHPGFQAELAGAAVWRWKHLYQIVLDLVASLGSEALIISVLLAVAFRSLSLGLIALVPNIFPLAVTGTGMFLFGNSLELISVLAFTVCLAIAVDDTVHFLTRYTEELKRGFDHHEAIHRSFVGVGSACIMTSLVLVCGFSTVLWSDTREHHIFATMGVATISFALLGDLIFLPAMLATFHRRKQNRGSTKA